MRDQLAKGEPYISWLSVNDEVEKESHIRSELNTKCLAVTDQGVVCSDAEGKETVFVADSVILACGMQPLANEVKQLRDVVNANVITVGDCQKAAAMADAVNQGYFAGYSIR